MQRKVKILFTIAQLLIVNLCIAQYDFDGYMQIGVSGGYSLSTVDFEPNIRQSEIGGVTGGLVINYFAEKNVGIQLEFNYSQQGWEDTRDTAYPSYKRQVNYYQIPLLAHISWHIKSFRFQVDLGPYVAFQDSYSEDYNPSLVSSEASLEDTVILGGRTYYGQPLDSEIDYGFMVGIGPGFSTKYGEFQIKFRYIQGMQSVFKKYPEGNFRFSPMNSMYFGVGWVYPIYFGKKD